MKVDGGYTHCPQGGRTSARRAPGSLVIYNWDNGRIAADRRRPAGSVKSS